jgi:hypothetical protein
MKIYINDIGQYEGKEIIKEGQEMPQEEKGKREWINGYTRRMLLAKD